MAKKDLNAGTPLVANAPLSDANLATADNKPAVVSNKNQKNKKNANAKPNFFKRLGRVFKEMFSELKKVSWPTTKKTLASLATVIVVVLVFLIVVFGFDSLWGALLKLLVPGTQS